MAGITSDDIEIPSPIPAAKMFKAAVLDADNIIPKTAKHRIDAIDMEKMSLTYSVIDGDILSTFVESVSHELSVVGSPDGGSIYKNKITYNTKLLQAGDANMITNNINGLKEEAVALFKAIEADVLAHPDAY
ncbi:hypothetical protein C2S51_020908 [Perilla frutescens var. frutescens]|nr:hypothetical protein C2S51_020908 [Perilla frutescens var. frutescens]